MHTPGHFTDLAKRAEYVYAERDRLKRDNERLTTALLDILKATDHAGVQLIAAMALTNYDEKMAEIMVENSGNKIAEENDK